MKKGRVLEQKVPQEHVLLVGGAHHAGLDKACGQLLAVAHPRQVHRGMIGMQTANLKHLSAIQQFREETPENT